MTRLLSRDAPSIKGGQCPVLGMPQCASPTRRDALCSTSHSPTATTCCCNQLLWPPAPSPPETLRSRNYSANNHSLLLRPPAPPPTPRPQTLHLGGGRATGLQIGSVAVPFRCVMPIGAGFMVAWLQSKGFSPALKFLTRAIEGVVDDKKHAALPTSYWQVGWGGIFVCAAGMCGVCLNTG